MKVLTVDCTATMCLVVAHLRASASKQGVIINNQLIDDKRHIAYTWQQSDEVNFVDTCLELPDFN